ncbi:MAG: PEP-CTERM sorting domain-containing protein [Chthoniobacterales bacterium]
MTKKNHSFKILGLISAICLVGSLSTGFGALGYTTNFDGLTSNLSLSFQDGWLTNDEDTGITTSGGSSIGQSEFVKQISGYSSYVGDKVVSLGGLLQPDVVPGQNSVSLYRPFDITVGNGGNGSLYFTTNYAITDSAAPYSTRDTFAFTFTNAAGARVAAIRFAPAVTNLGIYLDKYLPGDILASSTITPSGLFQPYNTSPLFKLEVTIDMAGILNAAITDSTGTKSAIFTNEATASGILTENIQRVAATYNVTDTTSDNGGKVNAGSNSLILNNYSVIPEPSTVGLSIIAGLGGAAMMFRRRKAA